MKGKIIAFLFPIILIDPWVGSLAAQTNLITHIDGRNKESLNGKWHYIIDVLETGYYNYHSIPYDQTEWGKGFYENKMPKDKSELVEYSFEGAETLWVPGDWNSQREKLDLYEGTIWYKKSFDFNKKPGERVFLYFGAANYDTHTYLNEVKLGSHIGGFTPFNYEITDLLREKDNFVVMKVDNKRVPEGVPTVNVDWKNYGGITRDVWLVRVPETFIRDYFIQLRKGSTDEIEAWVKLDGSQASQNVAIEIPELKTTKTITTNEEGFGKITFKVNKLVRWNPDNPKLYNIIIRSETDKLSEKIGFRTIETKGTDILLNGKPVFLRGICIHEEVPQRAARAYSREDAAMLLGWVKEMNANFVRLAHYPHNEHIVRLAEEMGIMVWEEIPVYWQLQFENPETFSRAENMLEELITRDKNRAGVIIWSMANETPVSDARNDFLKRLTEKARSLDDTRLISAALEVNYSASKGDHRVVDDPFGVYPDIVSFNQYNGWYSGLPDRNARLTWEVKYDKPVIMSEFGAGALYGFHGDSLTRFSEEFQDYLYRETIEMLKNIPQLRGVTPWILADFRSPRRLLPNIQDGWNRKGLVSEKGEKKAAFYTLKKYYDELEKVAPK